MSEFKVKDLSLSSGGNLRISWAESHMPVLSSIRSRFSKAEPLKGLRVSACLHVTKETAVLMKTLKDAGAEVTLVASNPLSTQDDVAAALVEGGIGTFAWRGETAEEYRWALGKALEFSPHLTMDDGGDLTVAAHEAEATGTIKGGTEETTTGVIRLRAMKERRVLAYPIIAVNNARTKCEFDNVYGTGQSSLDGVMRATNLLLAGKNVVVAGYGYVGRGIAMRARGLGARVIVTEVDPIRALMASMDGYEVMPMAEAAPRGDVFLTATGNKEVVRREHLERMKDGAVLANSGHFNVEISLPDLDSLSTKKRRLRPDLEEYQLMGGRKLYLLAEGRLVNLVAAEGHPSEVMDMSFANQALALDLLARRAEHMSPDVHDIPIEVDEEVARLKLASMGVRIDELTGEQKDYLRSWRI